MVKKPTPRAEPASSPVGVTTLTSDKSTFTDQDQVTINFNTNEAKAGDVYKIVIPETGNGLDASGTYTVQAGQFQGDYGHAEWHEDVTNHQWIITDTFTKNNANNQPIILTTNANFNFTGLHSTGTFDRVVYLYKNNALLKTLHLTETVDVNPSLYWDQYNYDQSIYTMDGNQVLNHVVKPNTNYQWRFTANIQPNFNHGTTITIPMPEHFQLDGEATKQLTNNSDWFNKLHATISQSGNNVVISLPQLSNDQLPAAQNAKTVFNVVGKFVMAQPNGNTTLRATTSPSLVESLGETTPKQSTIDPTVVTIIGKDHGLDKLNEGEIFTGNISPDQTITKSDGTVENVTPMADTTNHDLNKRVLLNNLTPFDLTNLKINLPVPDGMNITGLSISDPRSSFSYRLTLNDGTQVTGNYSGSGDSISAPTGKTITNIELDFPKFGAYEQFGTIGLSGTLAKQYKDGSPVKVGQNLHTEFTVTADNLPTPGHFTTNQIIIESMPKVPEVHKDQFFARGYQNDNQPSTPDSGYIYLSHNDLKDASEELTYYIVLPNNAEINSIVDLPAGVTSSLKKINGHNVLILHGNFKRTDNDIYIHLNNTSLITRDNLSSPYSIFVVLPDGHSIENATALTSGDPNFAYVEGNTNAYELFNGNWRILAATGTYPATQAQGNQDLALTSQGKSDDKGRQNMTFTTDIVDSDSTDLQNVTIITAVPGTYDGKSQFDFHLTGPNSVHVGNEMTGVAVTSGFTNYYSTEAINLSTAHDDTNLMSHFVTADQVTDWSKIKTVLTKFDKVPANSVYGVHLDGVDPTIGNDPNKTDYASSVVWSDILNPLVITPGSKSSASITVSGQSTIHFKLQFKDGSHPDISIPSLDKTYQDGKDEFKLSDFLTSTKNSDFDDAKNTGIPEAIRKAIPSDYVLDVEDPRIEDAKVTFANGMPDHPAVFNQVSAYYFDGDTIVMELIKKVIYTETVKVKRRIKYVDLNGNEVKYRDTDGTLKTYPELDVPVKQISFTGKYNPLTGHQDPIDQDQFKQLQLDDSSIPNQIGGYLYINIFSNGSTQQIGGVTANAIYNGVKNLDQQVQNGYEIDVTENGYLSNGHQKTTIDQHTVNIIQDVTLTYVPSGANLILVGAGLGQTNQLLSSSSSVNADGSDNKLISFTDAQGHVINDAFLHRDGYTYKIYYENDTLNSITQVSGEDSVHYVNRSWLADPNHAVPSYNTLANAFAGKITGATVTNQTYDNNPDFQLDSNGKLMTNLGIAGNTQNFFVVYTPVEQRKQTLYILSDNDPYANDPFMKDFALPKTTADADKSGTDYFKVQGDTGDHLIHTNESGTSYNTFTQGSGSDTSYSTGQYDHDSEGHQIHHHIPHSDISSIGSIAVYERTGYYIPKATYQFTDAAGKTHIVTITNHLDLTKYDPDSGETGAGDQALLTILDYLTTGFNSGYSSAITLPNSGDAAFTISVDGITGAKISTTDSGIVFELPSDQTWVYDDTVYDNTNHANVDPQPQIITLSYAALPMDPEMAQVRIHYIDVDQVAPMNDSDRQSEADQGINLNPLTNRYSVNQASDSKAREWDPSLNRWTTTGGDGTTYNISKTDEDYDNTANDDAIIAKLAQLGYVVVQRDSQTRGKHEYDPSSSDYGNGSWDGNTQLPKAGAPVMAQNYYVYLKKAHQVQYQVKVEDANGNVETQPLIDKTELGVGGTNENVANTLVDWNSDSHQTIGQKYDQIIKDLATSQPNYTVVPHDSTDAKLKKTDEIPADATFTGTAPLLYTIYVTHKQGSVHIHYIDVDGKKPSGANDKYVSTDGTEIPSTEQDITNKNYGDNYTNTPWDYAAHHYVLAETEPAGATSGTINAKSSDVYVYLKHATEDLQSRTKTVTEKVHYVYADGTKAHDDAPTQTLTFTQKATKDLVTNQITYGDWTAAQSFDDVESPTIAGYTPDVENVKGQKITVTNDNYAKDLNVEKTVTYTPDTQKLTVTFIDDTTGKTLQTVSKHGSSDSDAKYNTKDDISSYEKQHYSLVSDSSNGTELVFDHDDKVDQSYVVHLTHQTQPTTDSETITRTIVDHVPGQTAITTKQPVTFTRTGTKDLVTSKTTWNDWTSKNDQWSAYTAHGKEGYTPDPANVDAKTVLPTDKDTQVDIYYTGDKQKLTVKFIDDTTGKVLKTVEKEGPSDSDAKYNTKDDITSYEKQHYSLVSDSSNGTELVFDHDDKVDQSYEVHLTHQTQPTTDSETITRTIVDHVPGQTAITTKQPVTFTRTGTKDLVTTKTTWNNWTSKNDQWSAYTAHGKEGYTPDPANVSAKTVLPTDKDTQVDIYYTADSQKLTVKYIDDTTGKVLKTVSKQGPSDSDAKYNTKSDITDYENQHYSLVSDSTNGNELVFDHDDAVDQSYEVHLTHQTQPAADSETITRTIIDHVPGQTAITTKQPVTFTRTGTKDLVNNHTAWHNWTSENPEWAAYAAHGKAGYTPDPSNVEVKTVQPTDKNTQVDIYYTADNQKLTVKYIDDTTGKTLKTVTKQGPSDSDAKYNTKNDIDGYLDDHYKLVSDSTNGAELVFDHDDAVDQSYEVHLSHETQPTSESKTITRTIVDHVPGQTAITTKQPVTFTRTGTRDLVTNQTTWNDWTSQDPTWAAYMAHGKEGYTPDKSEVVAKTVRPTDQNVQVDIYYSVVPHDNGANPSTPASHQSNGQNSTPTNETVTTNTPSLDHQSKSEIPSTESQKVVKDSSVQGVAQAKSASEKSANNARLPQTGSQSNELGMLGLGISLEASLLGLLGLNKRRKRN